MAKTLPASFPLLTLDRFQVGQPLTARDYKSLVERSHYLFALHRGRCTGWNWDYEAEAGGVFDNSIAGEPNLEDYRPLLLANRPLSGDVIRVGVRVFMLLATMNVTVYRMNEGANAATSIATFQVQASSGVAGWEWRENSVDIALSDVTVSGEIMPLLFTFSLEFFTITPPGIKSIQPFEAGLFDVAASDIP